MLLCELVDGVVGKMDHFLFTGKGNPTLKYINDVIYHIIEAEFYRPFKKRRVHSVKLAKSENNSEVIYSYVYIKVTHIQVEFYILLFGYTLAVVCMVKVVTWYHLLFKGRVS
jgi:hypothetical protein